MNLIKVKIKEIWKLTIPITTSFVAIGMMGIVDTIIVGRYDTNQLAYMGIANSVFMILFTIPIALLQGVMIKTSQKFGARKFASCGKIYNEGRRYLVFLAIIFTAIGLGGVHILKLLGQTDQMAYQGGKILQVLSLSIPFILLGVNANFFLQSIKRPHISMYSAIAANVINIIINPVVVYGLFGVPEMGAMGAAGTTVIIRVFLAIFSLVYIAFMKKSPKLTRRFGLDRKYDTWWFDSRTTRKIGFGVAITTVATNGSFSMSNIFAGWLGEQIMATYVIITTVGGILFMLFFSITQAT
ncbi:MAG: polysaccharide biosynthesis C-terminal domain-containing protein, partial [Lactobacillus sp.]|nr:polysaccharide biosynthesis C-terminal domain-containing protein [Lactobacillus sp.]